MKKRYFIIAFIIAFVIFICPNGVEAKTQCKYTWTTTAYSNETDSNGKRKPVDYDFVLETEKDSKKLTKAISPFNQREAKFANGEGLNLNSDDSCPKIVLYDQAVVGGFKIYKTMTTCKDGLLTNNDRCYQLTGTKTTGNTSASNETGKGVQFRLNKSTGNSCEFIHVSETNSNISNKIVIEKKSGTNVKGSCSVYLGTCNVDVKVPKDFYVNKKFTCPPSIYATYDVGGKDANNYMYTVYEIGTENDEDRSGPESSEIDWDKISGNVNSEDFNKPIECEDIIDVSTEGSFGWMLNTILNYIKVIGPILVVLLSAIDFVKAVLGFDEKAMKEAQNKLIIRLVAAISLFLVPTLVQLIFSFINQTTCAL